MLQVISNRFGGTQKEQGLLPVEQMIGQYSKEKEE